MESLPQAPAALEKRGWTTIDKGGNLGRTNTESYPFNKVSIKTKFNQDFKKEGMP
jgi:hypothetical protein